MFKIRELFNDVVFLSVAFSSNGTMPALCIVEKEIQWMGPGTQSIVDQDLDKHPKQLDQLDQLYWSHFFPPTRIKCQLYQHHGNELKFY